jgi:hypothetical protein
MEYDPLVINNTMNFPDTLTTVWEKCNLNFEAISGDLSTLEAEGVSIEIIDGGLVE